MPPRVAIIILNWQQSSLTGDLVRQFQHLTTNKSFSWHIFLVDNCSGDNSFKEFQRSFGKLPNITLLQTASNLGFTGGNNFGIQQALKASFDYVLLLNNDVIINPNFLLKLLEAIQNDPAIGIVGPKIYFAPGHEYHSNRYQKSEQGKVIWSAGGIIDWNNIIGTNRGIDEVDHGQYDKIKQVDYLSGCCFLIRSKIIKQIGAFDPKYFMYMEDDDLCLRVHRLGYQIVYVPKSVIWHINAGSSSVGSPLADYFLTRNRLIFGLKYARLKTKIALFRESVKIFIFSPSEWQKKGVLDFYLHRWGRGSWPNGK